jgi:hypothetical protein
LDSFLVNVKGIITDTFSSARKNNTNPNIGESQGFGRGFSDVMDNILGKPYRFLTRILPPNR